MNLIFVFRMVVRHRKAVATTQQIVGCRYLVRLPRENSGYMNRPPGALKLGVRRHMCFLLYRLGKFTVTEIAYKCSVANYSSKRSFVLATFLLVTQ